MTTSCGGSSNAVNANLVHSLGNMLESLIFENFTRQLLESGADRYRPL
jgi:hypothetical protein